MAISIQAKWPRWLGYLGLIPIVFATTMLIFNRQHGMLWGNILVTYAVVILSFLGALHWAFAMTLDRLSINNRQAMFVWSVIPSLIAWAALFLPQTLGCLLLSCFFVFALWMDIRLGRVASLPAWYLPLRFKLTTVMTLGLMTAAYLLKPVIIHA